MHKLIFTLLLFPLVSYADKRNTDSVYLEKLSVHLFLEKSGVFSKDITVSKEFMTHNYSPDGEGIPEGEIFHSYLVKILFSSDKEIFVPSNVATLKVINRNDKKVIFNKTISGIYIGPERAIYKSFLVSGNECKYQILTVSTKEKTIKKQLPFHCGE